MPPPFAVLLRVYVLCPEIEGRDSSLHRQSGKGKWNLSEIMERLQTKPSNN
jgi:hypothetical protein